MFNALTWKKSACLLSVGQVQRLFRSQRWGQSITNKPLELAGALIMATFKESPEVQRSPCRLLLRIFAPTSLCNCFVGATVTGESKSVLSVESFWRLLTTSIEESMCDGH
jgi:hypothetical protein